MCCRSPRTTHPPKFGASFLDLRRIRPPSLWLPGGSGEVFRERLEHLAYGEGVFDAFLFASLLIPCLQTGNEFFGFREQGVKLFEDRQTLIAEARLAFNLPAANLTLAFGGHHDTSLSFLVCERGGNNAVCDSVPPSDGSVVCASVGIPTPR